MSLINQMLRDLEARHAQKIKEDGEASRTQGGDNLPCQAQQKQGQVKKRILLGVCSLLLLGVGTGSGWYLAQHRPAQTSAAPEAVTAPRISVTKPPAAATRAPQESVPEPTPEPEPLSLTDTPAPAQAKGANNPGTSTTAGAQVQSPVPEDGPQNMPPEAQQARQSSTISAPDPKPEPENDASQVTVTEATDPLKQRQRILRQAEQLYSDGDYPGAVNLLRQHLEQRHPRHNTYASDAELRALDADIYRHMALAQLRLERTSAALKTLERGHRHAPDNIDLHMLYARILLEEEKGERAYAMLRDLPQPLLADNPDFYALRAALARNQGVFSEAVELYTLLCRAQPQHGAWRLGLAISQHQQGNLDAAYRNYQLAADSGLEPRLREFASRQAQELFSHK